MDASNQILEIWEKKTINRPQELHRKILPLSLIPTNFCSCIVTKANAVSHNSRLRELVR